MIIWLMENFEFGEALTTKWFLICESFNADIEVANLLV